MKVWHRGDLNRDEIDQGASIDQKKLMKSEEVWSPWLKKLMLVAKLDQRRGISLNIEIQGVINEKIFYNMGVYSKVEIWVDP